MPPQKTLPGGIENDELDVVALGDKGDAVGEFAKHGFVEQIVFGTIQGHASDAGFDAMLDELEFFRMAALRFGLDFNGVTAWHDGILLPERAVLASKFDASTRRKPCAPVGGMVRNEFAGPFVREGRKTAVF